MQQLAIQIVYKTIVLKKVMTAKRGHKRAKKELSSSHFVDENLKQKDFLFSKIRMLKTAGLV